MERFGWPMGPAYLLDVVGIDTAHHADSCNGRRLPGSYELTKAKISIDRMYKLERFGQKNSKGFYRYELDRKGKPKKLAG